MHHFRCFVKEGLYGRKSLGSRTSVAHACNLSYWGVRDQEDCSSKPARANSSARPYLEKPFTKIGWWSGSRCRPWVQTPVPPKTEIKEKEVIGRSHAQASLCPQLKVFEGWGYGLCGRVLSKWKALHSNPIIARKKKIGVEAKFTCKTKTMKTSRIQGNAH
jgi:hypothetical protein